MSNIPQRIRKLKKERAEEWKKGKQNRDDEKIQSIHDSINNLKKAYNE